MVEKKSLWLTPLLKQCFVTLGVSLNMGQMGLVMGFSSVLLPQLKSPDSIIPIDDNNGSWIASLPGIAITIGNITIPAVMTRFGRKIAYIGTIILSMIGWLSIAFAKNMIVLLVVRLIQGIAIGMIFTLGPLLVGEYTSPKNRGAFLMFISVVVGLGVLTIHTIGSFLNWQLTSIVCIGITVFTLLLAMASPESPSWLASQGRYDECKSTFRWLRGDTEEDELEKMINTNVVLLKAQEMKLPSTDPFMLQMKKKIKSFGQTIRKNEVYKPIVIMLHIYAMAQWCGVNLLASYATDFIQSAVGTDVNVPVMSISLDIQRTVCNAIALIIIKKIKRRTMLFLVVSLNVISLLLLVIFTYCRANNLLPFDDFYNYYIGIVLIVILTLAIAMGALPMSFILAGEIFPQQYKNIAGGFSCLFFSINLFLCLKTVPILMSTINIYGLYLMYAGFLIYFLIVLGYILPETKDKTLQDIEEEFRGKEKKKPVEIVNKADASTYI